MDYLGQKMVFLARFSCNADSMLYRQMHNVFIPLDVYRKKLHNNAIKTKLEAWLGFLAFDDLERIWEISRYAPVFGEMYHELSEFRRKPKEVRGIFKKMI